MNQVPIAKSYFTVKSWCQNAIFTMSNFLAFWDFLEEYSTLTKFPKIEF